MCNFDNPNDKILEKVKKQGDLLGGKKGICNVNTGLFTAADKIFVLKKTDIKKQIFNLNNLEKTLFKPLFKNSDINKYICSLKTEKSVIYHYEKANYNISEIPNIISYLNKYKEKLLNRKDNSLKGALKRGRWDVISLPKIAIDFESKKIVAPQRSRTNTFGYNEIPWYASADVYFITEKDTDFSLKYILALLNSKLYYQWLYHRGKRKGETLELYQKPLSEIPIKKISEEKQNPFIELVDKILKVAKDGEHLRNPSKKYEFLQLETEIDARVAHLYGLTEEEYAKILEGTDDTFRIKAMNFHRDLIKGIKK